MVEYEFLVKMIRRSTESLIRIKIRATCVDHAEAIAREEMPNWEVVTILPAKAY